MQNFQTRDDPKWLPKTRGSNLFKEKVKSLFNSVLGENVGILEKLLNAFLIII